MKLSIKKGTTSQRAAIFVQDSSQTDGRGLSGLLFNSAGLAWYYWREDEGNAAGTQVTLATATRGTFASGGFIEKDATNMPGFYEIGIPNAALATGASWVVMVLRGATNMAPVTLEIQLVDNNAKDVYDRIGAPAGASVSADIAAIEAQTDDIGAAGAGLTAIPWNAAWDAEVQSEVQDAIEANNLDHIVGTATGIPAVPAGTYLDQIMDDGTAAFDRTTDSLQAIRDRGDAAWTTGAGGSDRLLMVDTTIATLASQTSFTLTSGSADDGAYEGCTIVIEDAATSTQKAIGIVDVYTGATKTVTLLEDPGVFTMAVSDKVYILAEKGLKPTTSANYHVDVSSGGTVGIDWGNVDNQSTAVDLSATDIQLCDTVTTNTDMRGTDSAALAANYTATRAGYLDNINNSALQTTAAQTGDSFARLGAPAGASVSADIAAIDSELVNVPKVLARGTAQSATSTTIVLAASTSFANDIPNGTVINIISGTGAGQSRPLRDYVGATDTATVHPAWTTNPSSDSVYEIVNGSVNVETWMNRQVQSVLNIGDGVNYPAVYIAGASAASGQTSITNFITNYTGTITSFDGLNDLDAAGIRSAVGLASANLDTQLADIPTVAEFNARTLVAADYFDPATDTVANVTLVGTCTTNTDMRGTDNAATVSGIFTTQMTEAYRATGAAGTLAQYIHEIIGHLGEFAISGTTKTTKKLDGTTTAKTYTLDDATSPTSITEAT